MPEQTATAANDPLPRLQLGCLQIEACWERPTRIPPTIIANVLRGAFAITFRQLVCPPDWLPRPCKACAQYGRCAYGQLFEPTPPGQGEGERSRTDLPRPFVLKPPLAEGDGHALTFGLTLFGRAMEYLSFFVFTLEELGRRGLGVGHTPFTIQRISATGDAGITALYTATGGEIRRPEAWLTEASLQPPADSLTWAVTFLTPTLLTTGSNFAAKGPSPGGRGIAKEVRAAPPLGVVARRLRDRLAALAAFFGAPWETDFTAIGQLADEVELLADRTRWMIRHRQSTRTGQTHELSGLTGEVVYRFPTPHHRDHLVPLLRCAEQLHVGKHAVWGNGWLQTEPVAQK